MINFIDNLNIEITSNEHDNLSIFHCAHDWTVKELQNNNYDLLKNAKHEDLNMILDWLTNTALIAEGLNIKLSIN